MSLSLKNRFLVPTLGIIIVGMFGLTAVSFFKSRATLTNTITDQIEQMGESTATVASAWMKARKMEVAYWATEKSYEAVLTSSDKTAVVQAADARLGVLLKELGYYENICITDPTGQVLASGDPKGKVQVADREYFKEAIKGNFFVSDALRSKVTGRPVCALATPMRDGTKIIGVCFAVLDLGWFNGRFIEPVKVGTKGYALLVNKEGKFLSHPDKELILNQNLSSIDGMGGLLGRSDGLVEFTSKGEEYLAATHRDKEMNWLLVVLAPKADVLSPVKDLGIINLVVACAVVILAAVIILLLVRSILRPLNRTIDGLNEASDQVDTGAVQVSQSSTQLADGASQQAAALEESSSSLEEMTSMTRQNADNANQANALMKESIKVIGVANDSMGQLTTSMREISEASEETSKIIKTIDEIAFQTNLLALNAAVEAARAGEAGAGFAVVADEVRSLAMRAADAAKNTAALIEKTVRRVNDGGGLVNRTNDAFLEVARTSSRVDELLGEIAAASQEQAHGIEQVNRAVAEMDKVTQQTAAIAEESSSASEEMSAQATEMKTLVAELVRIIGRGAETKKTKKRGSTKSAVTSAVARVIPGKRAEKAEAPPAVSRGPAPRALPGRAQKGKPAPRESAEFLDDDDF